jgi:hypothetical protein
LAWPCCCAGWLWGTGPHARLPFHSWRRAALPSLFLALPLLYLGLRRCFTPAADALDPLGPVLLLRTALESFPLNGTLLLGTIALGLWRCPQYRGPMLAWLALAGASALPGVGMDRVDVAIYSLLFLLTAAAPGLQLLLEGPRPRANGALALLLTGQVAGLAGNWARMDDLRPHSLYDVRRNCQVLHGFLHDRGAVVPPARRERLQARYSALGFPADKLFAPAVEAALTQAADAGQFLPTADGTPFRHAWDYLSSKPGLYPMLRLHLRRLPTPPQ